MASSIDDLLNESAPSVTDGRDDMRLESVAILRRLEAAPRPLTVRRRRRPVLLAVIVAVVMAGFTIPALAGAFGESSGSGPVAACMPTFQAVTSDVNDAQGSSGGPQAILRANTYLQRLDVAAVLKSTAYQSALRRAEAEQGPAGGASPSASALLSVVSDRTTASLVRAGLDPTVVRVVMASTCP